MKDQPVPEAEAKPSFIYFVSYVFAAGGWGHTAVTSDAPVNTGNAVMSLQEVIAADLALPRAQVVIQNFILLSGPEDLFAAGVAAGRAQAATDIRSLIADLVDPDVCSFDHHGHCQAHGWPHVGPRCPHARAKEWLAAGVADLSKDQRGERDGH